MGFVVLGGKLGIGVYTINANRYWLSRDYVEGSVKKGQNRYRVNV